MLDAGVELRVFEGFQQRLLSKKGEDDLHSRILQTTWTVTGSLKMVRWPNPRPSTWLPAGAGEIPACQKALRMYAPGSIQ